jgi:hypothetical protein
MADGTAGPGKFADDFLRTWEATTSVDVHIKQPAAGPYDKVRLYNFTFLGTKFRDCTYSGRQDNKAGAPVSGSSHKGAGVCDELAKLLISAQRDIYQAYAAEVTSQREPEQPTESGFKTWCNVAEEHIGWDFRNGEHARGSALDINAAYQPYIATYTGNVYGGEQYRDQDPRLDLPHTDARLSSEREPDEPATAAKGIRPLAIDAYKRAWALRFPPGTPLDISVFHGTNRSETIEQTYDRFLQLHSTLVAYFDLAYARPSPSVLHLLPNQSGQLRVYGSGVRPDLDSYLGRVELYRTYLFKNLPTGSAELARLFDDIQHDYAALRLVMVTGSLSPVNSAGFNGSSLALPRSRNPSRGFLRMRKQIVVILRKYLARWGAIDFGAAASGDVMHFDRGKGAPVAVTRDTNAGNIFYV